MHRSRFFLIAGALTFVGSLLVLGPTIGPFLSEEHPSLLTTTVYIVTMVVLSGGVCRYARWPDSLYLFVLALGSAAVVTAWQPENARLVSLLPLATGIAFLLGLLAAILEAWRPASAKQQDF